MFKAIECIFYDSESKNDVSTSESSLDEEISSESDTKGALLVRVANIIAKLMFKTETKHTAVLTTLDSWNM